MVREIEQQDEDVRRLKQEISAQKGSTYFARMQYGRLVDAALQAHSEKYVADIFVRSGTWRSRPAQQTHRRQDDHERRVPGRARQGAAFDQRVKEIGARSTSSPSSTRGPGRRTTSSTSASSWSGEGEVGGC